MAEKKYSVCPECGDKTIAGMYTECRDCGVELVLEKKKRTAKKKE